MPSFHLSAVVFIHTNPVSFSAAAADDDDGVNGDLTATLFICLLLFCFFFYSGKTLNCSCGGKPFHLVPVVFKLVACFSFSFSFFTSVTTVKCLNEKRRNKDRNKVNQLHQHHCSRRCWKSFSLLGENGKK